MFCMKLSIVVPCRNEAGRIGQFLECLKRQTVRPEVLFIDGNSSDSTTEMIRLSGFDIIPEVGECCPANARNQGIALAT